MIFWQCNTIHLYNIPQNSTSLSTIAEIIGQSTFDANLELKLLLLCQLSIYCDKNFDTILLSVESELSLLSGCQFVGQVEWLSPTNFLHICWKQAKFNFHPDNFVQQLPSCESFGIALHLIITFFSTIWSLGALSGVRLQAKGRVISLKRVSRLWSWLLLRVLSTCYFLVYLLLRVLALVPIFVTRWRYLH